MTVGRAMGNVIIIGRRGPGKLVNLVSVTGCTCGFVIKASNYM